MTFTTRFAPSPTGPLHLGHAFSAILAHDMARAAGGQFLLRIEDIDRARARSEWEHQLIEDLRWLGLSWDAPPMRQSERIETYQTALDRLWAKGLLYACHCGRKDILAALSAPQEGVPIGPDGMIYPGTCRPPNDAPLPNGPCPRDCHLRLRMDRAASETVKFVEEGQGENGENGLIRYTPNMLIRDVGDVVLCRRDFGTSYHLSVVLDDAAQGITHVVRGADLFEATQIHVLLQQLLDLPTPVYHHHRLIRDDAGKRLAKRDDARALSKYRAEGASPQDIRSMLGL